jgi:hypothetical protein
MLRIRHLVYSLAIVFVALSGLSNQLLADQENLDPTRGSIAGTVVDQKAAKPLSVLM